MYSAVRLARFLIDGSHLIILLNFAATLLSFAISAMINLATEPDGNGHP